TGVLTPPAVQPLRLPVSKPPLVTIEPPPPDEFTTRLVVALWLALPSVPVTVRVEVPAGVVEAVETVSVEELPAVTGLGLKLPLAPEGSPLTARLTEPAEPEVTVVETVYVVDCPWVTVWLEGETEIEKSLVGAVPQFENLKDPIRVCQLKAPVAASYSFVYQKVQSSPGSTVIAL